MKHGETDANKFKITCRINILLSQSVMLINFSVCKSESHSETSQCPYLNKAEVDVHFLCFHAVHAAFHSEAFAQ
jgi:hypothetical protein